MKVKNFMLCWLLMTLTAVVLVTFGVINNAILSPFVLANGILVSVPMLLLPPIKNWKEISEMPVTDLMRALLFKPDKRGLHSTLDTINEIFYDISLDNEIEFIGVYLANLIWRLEYNEVDIPWTIKIKLFGFYQKHQDLMEKIKASTYSDKGRKELMRRVPEAEIYIVELAKIIDSPEIERRLHKKEVSGKGDQFNFLCFQNHLKAAERNYIFLTEFVAKQANKQILET